MADDNVKTNREVEAPVEAPKEGVVGKAAEEFRNEIYTPTGPATGSSERNSTGMQRLDASSTDGTNGLPGMILENKGKGNRLDMKQGQADDYSKLGRDAVSGQKNPGELKDPGAKLGEKLPELKDPFGPKIGEKMPGFGEKDSESMDEMKKELEKSMQESEEQEEGVEQLPTGDHIVREDGRETLFTPNGDRITLNPDGTHTIRGDVRKVTTDQEGRTTVEFRDGGRVRFDDQGFLSVERNGQGVGFARRSYDFGGGGGKGGGKMEGVGPGQDWPRSPGDKESPAVPKPNHPIDSITPPNSPNVPIDRVRPQQPQPKPELPVDRVPMERLLKK